MRRSIRVILCVSVLAVAASCQQKTENSTQQSAEASAKQPVGKVALAVASAVGSPAPAASSGPPADGILEPSRAETEAPSGQAPKLAMGATGAEPRIVLRTPKATLPRALKIEVTLQAGMDQGLPPIELNVGLESKPTSAA